jgi:ABC-2 type transport system permease protein
MLTITWLELYKVFTRPRSYIGFLAIIIFVAFTHIAVYMEGQEILDFLTQNLENVFTLQGNLINGYMVTYLVLNFMWVHIPLLIVLVTGDLFSGESHNGTFRLLLTRPVSRTKLVNAKFIAASLYTGVLVLFLGLFSLPLGLIVFGKGDLMVLLETLNIIPQNELMMRFTIAFAFGLLSMITVASLSLMLSSFSESSIGPILLTIAIIILLTLVSSINLKIFNLIRPFLFTSYLNSWMYVFRFDIQPLQLLRDAYVLGAHIVVFYFVTWYHFNRKDILS